MHPPRPWRLLPLLALLASLAGQAATVKAATLTVCPSGCPYSQIQPAINAAHGGDTISIAAGAYSGGIDITKNLTLLGVGAGSTIINGGGPVVTVNNSVTATLQGLTISGGNRGVGGIINDGTLTLTDSTISGNSGSDGGGIFSDGTLTLTNSTVSGNSAGRLGGGIFNLGTVTLTNSTVSGNSTTDGGGGIFNFRGTVTLSNTLLATNTANGTGPDCNGALIDGPGGHNLLGIGVGCTGLTNGSNGDQVGTGAKPIDPKLGPLQNNGGPTPTQALLSGSPAIGGGNAATCLALTGPDGTTTDTDQRGSPRHSALRSACDIGAFDTGGAPSCSRTINQPTAGNLAVTSGTICVVGTTVGGRITVAPGASLSLLDANVSGAVQSQGAGALLICGSTLSSLDVRQTSGAVLVGGGQDGDQGCLGNTIKGKVVLDANQGGVELGGNQIGGSLQVTNNAGSGPDPEDAVPEVEGNQISGSLTCTGNTPAPSNDGQTNTVTGARSGQCAAGF